MSAGIARCALVVAVLSAGCAGSASDDRDATTATLGPTSVVTELVAASSSTSLAPIQTASTTAPTNAASSTPPSTDPDGVKQITASFVTFFDGQNTDVDAKVASLEDGANLRSMIVDAIANPQFASLTTQVNAIRMLTDADCLAAGEVAPCAEVVHDLFLGGLPAFVGRVSHAVQVDHRWVVSRSSWCSIVEIGGDACP